MDLHEVPLQLTRDSYFPEGFLIAPVNFLEDNDPLEDEEENNLEEVEESKEEGII